MNSELSATAVLPEPAAAGQFSSLVEAASVEFQAALQLLAERARYVTGSTMVAIALEQRGRIIYVAGSGTSAPEPGGPLAPSREDIVRCIAECRIVTSRWPTGHVLLAPVVRDSRAVGVVELCADFPFEASDNEHMSRITALISVALEHRQAAEDAEERLSSEVPEPPQLPAQSDPDDCLSQPDSAGSPAPKLWHAPEASASHTQPQALPAKPPNIESCSSCGFPVSPGRKLCLECEQNPTAASSAEIFTSAPEENWLVAHGYTIASLLATALAAAIVLWLRR